jgi:hypothetical protein
MMHCAKVCRFPRRAAAKIGNFLLILQGRDRRSLKDRSFRSLFITLHPSL